MAVIEVKDLTYSYGRKEKPAISDVNFSIEKGEIFGFLGPSGAGKSTTQGLLAGLLHLKTGEILIDGKPRKGFPDKAFFNRIGMGFEIPNVYRKLTGLDNLRFHASLYDGKTEDPIAVLEMVGLKDEAGKKAGEYSKGMKQRLGFARSMINNPDIWFLDEPTMGLDPGTANSIKSIIKRKKKDGVTIFLTTHNMYVADELCDRVGFIVDGRIAVLDTPKNLKLKYGQPTVAAEYMLDGKLESREFSLADSGRTELADFIRGNDIKTLHSGEPSLEDIFIKITGRALE